MARSPSVLLAGTKTLAGWLVLEPLPFKDQNHDRLEPDRIHLQRTLQSHSRRISCADDDYGPPLFELGHGCRHSRCCDDARAASHGGFCSWALLTGAAPPLSSNAARVSANLLCRLCDSGLRSLVAGGFRAVRWPVDLPNWRTGLAIWLSLSFLRRKLSGVAWLPSAWPELRTVTRAFSGPACAKRLRVPIAKAAYLAQKQKRRRQSTSTTRSTNPAWLSRPKAASPQRPSPRNISFADTRLSSTWRGHASF
jgi:hypothetical protein